MELTWGFLSILALLIVPGYIIRRCYYFGEFSKQFGHNENVAKLIFYALIPGLFNALISFVLYDGIVTEVDLGQVIDAYKEISNSSVTHKETDNTPIKTRLIDGAVPFLIFSYLIAVLVGGLFGHLVRWLRLDTRYKIFRFRNHWYYLFSAEHGGMKKYKFLKRDEQFLFTQADILVETETENNLYSGIIVDYELSPDDCSKLKNIILHKASRYSYIKKKNKRVRKDIPGNLFIVQCDDWKNINLTYVFGRKEEFIHTVYPRVINRTIGVISILILPLLFYQPKWLVFDLYNHVFSMTILGRVFLYLFLIQLLSILTPFTFRKEQFHWIGWKLFWSKVAAILLLGLIAFGIEKLSIWVLNSF